MNTLQNYIRICLQKVTYSISKFIISSKDELKSSRNKIPINNIKGILSLIMVVLLFCSFLTGKKVSYDNIYKVQQYNKILIIQKDSLLRRIDSLQSANTKLNEQLHSVDYKRDLIYKSSGIRIPTFVSKQDIDLMFKIQKQEKIPSYIFYRIIQKESGFKKNAISCVGAESYFQVMPQSKRLFKKMIPHADKMSKTELNIRIGAKILKYNYNKFSRKNVSVTKNWERALVIFCYGDRNINRNLKSRHFSVYKKYIFGSSYVTEENI